MSEQKYKDEIEQLTNQLKTEKKENESLKTKIRVRGQELGFRSEELLANAIEMVRMSERIRELEINKPTSGAAEAASDATERVKELESELKTSQLARNELRQEFEEMRDLYEKSKPLEFFFQLQVAYDTPEMQSLTVEQFDKKIKCFFNMISDQCPDDNEKRLEHGRRVWKLLCVTQHPDKNRNDPCAGPKFTALRAAYQKFAE